MVSVSPFLPQRNKAGAWASWSSGAQYGVLISCLEQMFPSVPGNPGGWGCSVGHGDLSWAAALGTGAQVGGNCMGLLGWSDARSHEGPSSYQVTTKLALELGIGMGNH